MWQEEHSVSFLLNGLDPGWVEHDPDPGAHGLGRQVATELGADGSGVPVRAGHLHTD